MKKSETNACLIAGVLATSILLTGCGGGSGGGMGGLGPGCQNEVRTKHLDQTSPHDPADRGKINHCQQGNGQNDEAPLALVPAARWQPLQPKCKYGNEQGTNYK